MELNFIEAREGLVDDLCYSPMQKPFISIYLYCFDKLSNFSNNHLNPFQQSLLINFLNFHLIQKVPILIFLLIVLQYYFQDFQLLQSDMIHIKYLLFLYLIIEISFKDRKFLFENFNYLLFLDYFIILLRVNPNHFCPLHIQSHLMLATKYAKVHMILLK